MKTPTMNRRLAEMYVVGLTLLGNPARKRFERQLRGKFFYRDLEVIFEASIDTQNGDAFKTANTLHAEGRLDEAGGVWQIVECMEVLPFEGDIDSLIAFIAENRE